MNPEDVVSVQEAANQFADLMDDNLELAEETPGDEGLAERFEEELDEESEEKEEGESEESEEESEEAEEEEEEESEEDEESEQGAISDDALVDIEIDGEEYEVNLHELKSGYLRNEEYVKRSTELEAEHATRMAEVSQKEAELIREIEATAVIAQADLSRYQNVDWAKLKAEDPAKYATEFSDFMEKRQAIQGQLTRRNQIQQLQQKAEELKHNAFLQSQVTLARKLIPEFDDKDYHARVYKYADSIGISKDEVDSIADARHLLLLGQAMKFQESQVKKKDVVKKKVVEAELPPVIKPRAKTPAVNAEKKRQQALEQRLASTGSVRDAAAAFEAFI